MFNIYKIITTSFIILSLTACNNSADDSDATDNQTNTNTQKDSVVSHDNTISKNPKNDNPTVKEEVEKPTIRAAITSVNNALLNQKITLSADQSIGDNLSYQWELITPEGSSSKLDNSSQLNSSFTPDISGNYTLSLNVIDKNGLEHSHIKIIRATETVNGINFKLSNVSDKNLSDIAFTFAQPFINGAFPKDQKFSLKINDTNEIIPLQIDAKASHKDNSLRHAIFSGILSNVSAKQLLNAELVPFEPILTKSSVNLEEVIQRKFESNIALTINGEQYTLSLLELLKNKPEKLWLDGNLVREWMVSGSFKNNNGEEHPHLYGRFNLRIYGDFEHILVDTVIENTWTYQANPHNINYDAAITINGEKVYEHNNLYHHQRARWRKQFWVNNKVEHLHIAHDTQYLINTNTVPNYDPRLINNISDKLLNFYKDRWQNKLVTYAMTDNGKYAKVGEGHNEFTHEYIGPMGIGLANPRMASVGGRPDIGPLPRWSASYILNQDPITKKVSLGMGDLSASWPVHFRDKDTGLMLSLDDYPYASTVWSKRTTKNRTTGKYEHPTECIKENKAYCNSPFRPDTAHQPSMNFIPYLLTGDYFHLEEQQFWTNFSPISMNPHYRGLEKATFDTLQIRGEAWVLRTLAHTAYITPDDDPFKNYFNERLQNNIDNYLAIYIDNPPNQYGAVKPGGTYPTTSPWMDDFFTWAVGATYNLGFTDIGPLLKWKARFPVQRMGFGSEEAKTFCWIFAASYHMLVAPDKNSPMFQTIDQVYNNTNGKEIPSGGGFDDHGEACGSQALANKLNLRQNQMTGYDYAHAGFPANMQIALATAVDAGIEGAAEAWQKFSTRPVQPDYTGNPNFGVVPKK